MSLSSLRSFEYLESLPGTTFNKLYRQPSTALAIFRRMLPHLAKSFVMALLYISKPLPVADLDSWVRPSGKGERESAVSLLQRLHILSATAQPGKPRAYALTNPFADSLRLALTGGGNHASFGVPCDPSADERVTIAELDEFARRQWEGVLGYMVGSTGVNLSNDGVQLSPAVTALLNIGNLVETRAKNTAITQAGFAFILQEVNAQVWTILILYLQNAEQLKMVQVDVLSFLFMLGSLELGLAYSKSNLSPSQMTMLQDLRDFGLVYEPSPDSPIFYPTRLATPLTSDSSGLLRSSLNSTAAASSSSTSTTTGGGGGGFIVVETNYRIYAYTNSTLQIAILQLFTRLQTRYPNMVAGKITRESIRRAVATGITSDQIISYLTTHAHPQMRSKASNSSGGNSNDSSAVIPPTVIDQIRLWQIENDRMKTTPGFLLKEFNTKEEYESLCRYAQEIGVLKWKSDEDRMFFATRYEQLAGFLKSRKERAVAEG